MTLDPKYLLDWRGQPLIWDQVEKSFKTKSGYRSDFFAVVWPVGLEWEASVSTRYNESMLLKLMNGLGHTPQAALDDCLIQTFLELERVFPQELPCSPCPPPPPTSPLSQDGDAKEIPF